MLTSKIDGNGTKIHSGIVMDEMDFFFNAKQNLS